MSIQCLLSVLLIAPLTPPPAVAPTSRPATTQPSRAIDRADVDEDAIRIAERTLDAMGGADAWQDVAVIQWEFLGGSRRHLWDKQRGLGRVEGTDDTGPYVTVVDLAQKTGRAWRDGAEVEDAAEAKAMVEAGYAAWVNDSYWLVMPYKLLDPGVRLRLLGDAKTEAGAAAQRLEVTFEDAGLTPQNKYHVYVGGESGLVEQWDFFPDRADTEPRFRIPWADWKAYGAIKLSGNRGESRGRPLELRGIRVLDDAPAGAFDDPAPLPDA